VAKPNQYGPWATSIGAFGNPQLSAFWRKRLTRLALTSQSSPTLSRRSLLCLGAAGVLTGALPTFHLAAAADPQDAAAWSVERLVDAVKAESLSIDSVYCEFSYRFNNSKHPTKCKFARSGGKWHYAELMNSPEGQSENISCCDGQLEFTFIVAHLPKAPSSWSGVQLHLPRREYPGFTPECLLGTNLSNVSRSAADAFTLKGVAVTKSEVSLADGTKGPRLLASDVSAAGADANGLTYDVAVTLDPKHGLLPAEILVTQPEKRATRPGWEQRWKVQEYRRIVDEKTKRERWFPVSGILTQGLPNAPTVTLTVDKVQINPKLPSTLFRPDVPVGTSIDDTTPDKRGRLFIAEMEMKKAKALLKKTDNLQKNLDSP
jgi:hypothetical protein